MCQCVCVCYIRINAVNVFLSVVSNSRQQKRDCDDAVRTLKNWIERYVPKNLMQILLKRSRGTIQF